MTTLTEPMLRELGALWKEGALEAARVLERARDPASALHAHFEWRDEVAGHLHRLRQADRLIVRARVLILPPETRAPREVRARVQTLERPAAPPLPAPASAEVPLAPAAHAPREVRLRDALSELLAVRRRYTDLEDELDLVFGEIDRLIRPGALDRLMLARVVRVARELEDQGLDRPTAAARAAKRYGVSPSAVLELVRAGMGTAPRALPRGAFGR